MSGPLDRMRANSQAGWTIDDVAATCREFGMLCEAPRGGDSHFKIQDCPSGPGREALRAVARPIKPVYFPRLVLFIDAVRSIA